MVLISPAMFIRKTTTRTLADGTTYSGFRLVHSVRVKGQVRQRTLLHLGSDFSVPKDDWKRLCRAVKDRLNLQSSPALPKELEREADRIVQHLQAHDSDRLRKANLAQSVPPSLGPLAGAPRPD